MGEQVVNQWVRVEQEADRKEKARHKVEDTDKKLDKRQEIKDNDMK